MTSTYSRLSSTEVAHRLSTSLASGLSPVDARARLFEHGPNELPQEEPEPLWLRFLKQFKEPLILLLLASASISAVMGNWDDAVSITIAVTIVTAVGFVQEYRSEKSLEALNRLVPHYAHLIRRQEDGERGSNTPGAAQASRENGRSTPAPGASKEEFAKVESASTTVPAAQLVPGDLVLFATGDRIPADVRITSAADLTIDESNLTGENEPVRKSTEAVGSRPAANGLAVDHSSQNSSKPYSYNAPAAGSAGADLRLNEQHNIAFMGTLVQSGYGQGIVIATGPRTEFGAISASLTEIESPRTPLQLSMDRLGQELSYMSFVVIFVIVIIGLWQGRKLLEMFTIGVSLAVAAIPEGLPIIVTVTLALGVLRMAKRGAIVRRLPSVETLGSVNVICSDKTGMFGIRKGYIRMLTPGRYVDDEQDDGDQDVASRPRYACGGAKDHVIFSRLYASANREDWQHLQQCTSLELAARVSSIKRDASINGWSRSWKSRRQESLGWSAHRCRHARSPRLAGRRRSSRECW